MLVVLCMSARAQQAGLSNLRSTRISARTSPVTIDSLSLVPGSIRIEGIPESDYTVDFINARLTWIKQPEFDSVLVSYRVFPYKLNAPAQRMRFDTVMGKFVVTPLKMPGKDTQEPLFDFGNISYNGSFGRGLSFGNRQDVVVNSSLNLQLNGIIGDSILLAAAISDNNIPIQPDGNTQNLNEFDQVYIQFSRDKWRFSIGDIDVRQQGQSYFLNFYKRLQGAAFETENALSPNITNKALVSGAVAKGKFVRNIFQGLEGNQGPYRLKGANGELFFIVLAGTERVWIDGELLQRGEDQDYVINYNTAEVTFTPKRMITKDRRIQIEFEYADRNYLNAQLYATDEVTFRNRLKIRVGAFHNNDAKNYPINQTLDAAQKQFLADIGDSTQQAFYPSAVPDTFAVGKILYEKRDTSYNGGQRDTVFVFSVDSTQQLYSLSFANVGQGNGDYIQDLTSAANGQVYKWVAPDSVTGTRQGQYAPAVFLVAPRKQQVFILGADYQVSNNLLLRTELATSVFDVNTFSSKDKANDQGFAARAQVLHSASLNKSKGRELKSELYYEHVGENFRPVERLRPVEFNRDWGIAFDAPAATENLVRAGATLQDSRKHALRYDLSGFFRGDGYQGIRNSIQHQGDFGGWRFNNQFIYTGIDETAQQGYFLRPSIDLNKELKRWGNYRFGVNYQLEHNQFLLKQYDTLTPTSFSFDIWQAYFRSPDNKPNKWGVSYFTRSDKYPLGKELIRADRSQNINFFTELMRNEHHQFRLNSTFRALNVIDDRFTTLQEDRTILGRAEYLANVWKGGVTGNVLYELGTGQEPRKDFSYLEVPPGQGEYTWNDYNNDGIQQLNEFEVARFQDQARYIRVFTPTTDFIKASYLQFNYSVVVNPRVSINQANANGFAKFASRLYFQSALQIGRKNIADGLGDFNPFNTSFEDSSLLTLDQLFSNTFSFNRFSSVWGIDLNNIRSSGRAFLSYGYETRQLNDWNLKGRVNIGKMFTVDLIAGQVVNQLLTPQFDNRNFRVEGRAVEPRLTFTKGTVFRAQAGYIWNRKKNTLGSETSSANTVNTEVKYNVLSNTALTAKFTFSQIEYNASPNTTVAYVMLNGLLPGQNFLWTADLTQRLSSFLELSFQYEGRKAGTSGVVHIGRAQLRALF
jgi:hypothetical protein